MVKKFLSIVVIIFLGLVCSGFKYESNQFSFRYSKDWEIVKESQIDHKSLVKLKCKENYNVKLIIVGRSNHSQ